MKYYGKKTFWPYFESEFGIEIKQSMQGEIHEIYRHIMKKYKKIYDDQAKAENSVMPKYEIDEYDLLSIEKVYEKIQFIMATQGYKMDNDRASLNEIDVFHTTTNSMNTYGVFDGSEFVVLKDSQMICRKGAAWRLLTSKGKLC